jgi:queuine tRNA-ribosyltransferase
LKYPYNFVPCITSFAGNTLTGENWYKAEIGMFAFSLQELLIKPGLEVLQNITSLQSYYGLKGEVVLRATLPLQETPGNYAWYSQYDGSLVTFNKEALWPLLLILKPNKVLLPQDAYLFEDEIESYLPLDMKRYYSASSPLSEKQDVALYFHSHEDKDAFWPLLQEGKTPFYVWGDASVDYWQEDLPCLIEWDDPMVAGIHGFAYTQQGIVSIMGSSWECEMRPLQADCGCETCEQGLTRAYLQHLFRQTPLLCIRYLIQHNLFTLQKNHYMMRLSRRRYR